MAAPPSPSAPRRPEDLLASLRGHYRLSPLWESSPFAWLKRLLPAHKGRVGEQLFAAMATQAGLDVQPRTSPGHDCRINDRPVEVKLSTAYDTADPAHATVKWLQVRPASDFELLALLAVCPHHVHLWVVDRATALRHSVGQHGGRAATETRMLEVHPDAPPSWLGPDLAGAPDALVQALARTT